jgi:hypothetical protein
VDNPFVNMYSQHSVLMNWQVPTDGPVNQDNGGEAQEHKGLHSEPLSH